MSLNATLGIACTITLALPVAVICINRFYNHRSLGALLIYYSLAALTNILIQEFVPLPSGVSALLSDLMKVIEVPLVLAGLLFFCPNKRKQKVVQVLSFAFISYELIVVAIHGIDRDAAALISGPGISIILIYSFYLFLRQVKFSIVHGKNQGRTLMLASLFFMYACYGLIYYFNYIMHTPYHSDVTTLFYIASIAGSVMMAIGLHMMRKRMKELEMLKITRKELAVFFGQTG